MAQLVKAVFVRDPDRARTVLLRPGEEPEPRLAALVTNPDAWQDGQLPDVDGKGSGGDVEKSSDDDAEPESEDTPKAATAAKKTAASKRAASRPARGRNAADQGDGGE